MSYRKNIIALNPFVRMDIARSLLEECNKDPVLKEQFLEVKQNMSGDKNDEVEFYQHLDRFHKLTLMVIKHHLETKLNHDPIDNIQSLTGDYLILDPLAEHWRPTNLSILFDGTTYQRTNDRAWMVEVTVKVRASNLAKQLPSLFVIGKQTATTIHIEGKPLLLTDKYPVANERVYKAHIGHDLETVRHFYFASNLDLKVLVKALLERMPGGNLHIDKIEAVEQYVLERRQRVYPDAMEHEVTETQLL